MLKKLLNVIFIGYFHSFFSPLIIYLHLFFFFPKRFKHYLSRICRSRSFVMTAKKDNQILVHVMQCPGNLSFLLMFLQA